MRVEFSNGATIKAKKKVLCRIAVMLREAADSYKNSGLDELAEAALGDATAISDALDRKGYFDYLK